MGRSRNGSGRHRQPWIDVTCLQCGFEVQARRTLPGKAMHVRTHFAADGSLCPPLVAGEERLIDARLVRRHDDDQLALF